MKTPIIRLMLLLVCLGPSAQGYANMLNRSVEPVSPALAYWQDLLDFSEPPPDERSRLLPHQNAISAASWVFNVPEQIIGAVVLVESNADPKASSDVSSAKGLMQTIDATFRFAKRRLSARGIDIHDPHARYDSILAGTWYLEYCFNLINPDADPSVFDNWEIPLQMYYVGPGLGRHTGDVVYVSRDGRKVAINKKDYSRKVLRLAHQMAQ